MLLPSLLPCVQRAARTKSQAFLLVGWATWSKMALEQGPYASVAGRFSMCIAFHRRPHPGTKAGIEERQRMQSHRGDLLKAWGLLMGTSILSPPGIHHVQPIHHIQPAQ